MGWISQGATETAAPWLNSCTGYVGGKADAGETIGASKADGWSKLASDAPTRRGNDFWECMFPLFEGLSCSIGPHAHYIRARGVKGAQSRGLGASVGGCRKHATNFVNTKR